MPRLLVVDDDLIYLDELCSQLRGLGYDVTNADSAQEAVTILDNGTFDLVICDTIMTGGGALSLLYDVRSRDSNFPFIVMTGRREIADSPLFRDGMRQASAKIEKSASLFELDKLIKSLLPR